MKYYFDDSLSMNSRNGNNIKSCLKTIAMHFLGNNPQHDYTFRPYCLNGLKRDNEYRYTVDFNTIYMQLINTPDARIPYLNDFGEDGDMPYDDNFPNVALPDMANWIDFTTNPDAGSFAEAFTSGFDVDYT